MIAFPQYAVDLKSIPVTQESLKTYEDIIVSKTYVKDAYNVMWGVNMETGFFWDGMHIDTRGLYAKSSFNTKEGIEAVEKFDRPSVVDKILSSKVPSKYRQTDFDVEWYGVVLACQNPNDRSIRSVGSDKDWWDFYEGACKFYGKNLFIKLHPWNSGEVGERICKIARDNGCRYEKTNHSCIKKCQFVLLYNSSFSVDCFLRDVPVAQYEKGYFYKTPAVTFTDRSYPIEIKHTDWGKRLANFLAYKYCFNMQMPIEKWVSLLRHFEKSKELFPINDEFCYINN